MRKFFIPLAFAMVLQTHAHAQPLKVGDERKGHIAARETQRWPVQIAAGNVVQGKFDADGAVLDLLDAQGRHLRRLVDQGSSPQSFMWPMEPDQQLQVAAGQENVNYKLSLTRVFFPADKEKQNLIERPLESPRLQALKQTLADGGNTDAFWSERATQGTPMTERLSVNEALVTFLWRGSPTTQSVRLFGGPSYDHEPLQKMDHSDVWWVSFKMPMTARLSYRLAPDAPQVVGSAIDNRRMILATAQRDPFNPHFFPAHIDAKLDVFQGYSVLELPGAPPQPWIKTRSGVAQGTLERHLVKSKVLGNERVVWLYRPASAKPQALLVLFDAHAYREGVPTPHIVDNLIADGLIAPTAVALVANASPEARATELPPNSLFTRFLDEELMPWIRNEGVSVPPKQTVVAGSSYGGLAAAYAGYQLPQWFGNVLSLSGSYWWAPPNERPGWMQRMYAQDKLKELRFYVDAGRYESARGGQEGILETSRELADVLRAKGYEVVQREHYTGHDYLHWQGALSCGLVALLNPKRFSEGLDVCNGDAH